MQENNELIIRDYLAVDRTKLANQRTLLSFIRTSIMLFVAGITLLKIDETQLTYFKAGILVISVGLIFLILGVAQYRVTTRKIESLYKK